MLNPLDKFVAGPFFSVLGWMTRYLNNAYGFIRHGIRVRLYAWYDKLLLGMIALDAVITYDRSIGMREAFVQEATGFLYHFRTHGPPARQGSYGRQM